MTAATGRVAAIAANSRATRVALLLTGLAGQAALAPLVSLTTSLLAALALVAVALSTVNLPITAATSGLSWRASKRGDASSRQVGALALILVASFGALSGLRAGDVRSEAATLALLLLFVQIGHTLASAGRREVALGCAVVLAMFAVASTFAGDATLLPAVLAGFVGIAVVATLLHRGMHLESADALASAGLSAVVRSCVAPVVLTLLVGLGAFLAMPSAGLHARVGLGIPGIQSATSGGSGSSEAGDRSATGLAGAAVLDLRARGPLSTAPVLSVPADAPLYWQGAIYDAFDGTAWTADLPLESGAWQRGDGVSAGTGGSTSAQLPPGGTASGRRDDVEVLGDLPSDAVFAPGATTSYTGPGRVLTDNDGAPHLIGTRLVAGDSYVVTSELPSESAGALRTAAGPDVSDPKWTAIPAATAPRVIALARELTTDAPDRFDAVESIENYLRTHEKYDLESPEPRAGDDAVDDFVFVSHRGFCEQFATAAVVMLRAVGVPARLVTGYAFGELDSASGRRVLLGTDAHAWVQVYYPGVGWVDSDPTAADPTSTAGGSGVPAPTRVASSSIRARIGDAFARAWRAVPGGRLGALLAVAALLLIGVAVTLLRGSGLRGSGALARWWARARRRWSARWRWRPLGSGRDPRRAVEPGEDRALAAYLRLEAALAETGRERAPGETIGEFARRRGAVGGVVGEPRVAPSDIAAAIRCVERECYARGARRPSSDDVDAAVEVFDRLRREVTATSVRIGRTAASD